METLLPLLLTALLRISVVLACGLLAVWLGRRASAATRHLLLVLAVVGALAAPLLSLTLPEVRIPTPRLPMRAEHALPVAPPVAAKMPTAAPSVPSTVQPHESVASVPTTAPEVPAPASARPTLPTIPPLAWLLVWAMGSVILLVRLFLGIFAAHYTVRRAEEAPDTVRALAAEIAYSFGLRRVPPVRLSAAVPGPAACGVCRVTVLLPMAAVAWSPEMLRAALLHEFSHIRRRDTLTQLLVELLGALYWFHPLVWLTARQMRIEREAACDDAVLAAGVPQRAYADVLLESVAALRGQRAPSFAGLSMARTPKIAQRLQALFDPRRNRHPLTRALAALCVLLALAVVVLVALPGARAALRWPFTTPAPENQHLILTRDAWRLHGPVKRVELYSGDRWEDAANPPQLLETIDFDRAGRVLQRKRYEPYARPRVLVEENHYRFDKRGRLLYWQSITRPVGNRSTLTPAYIDPWEAYQFTSIDQFLSTSSPARVQREYDRQGRILTLVLTPREPSAWAERMRIKYNKEGDPSVVERQWGKTADHPRIAYTYDKMGNWVTQRSDDEIITVTSNGRRVFRYLRRITYYPGTAREQEGLRYTRETLGLRGPVTAIEGPGLLFRLDRQGHADDFGMPVNAYLDRVTFDRRGRVIATTQWDGAPTAANQLTRERFRYYPDGTVHTRTTTALQPPFRSYTVSSLRGLLLGEALLATDTPAYLDREASTHTCRYDARGRVVAETLSVGEKGEEYYAHATCRYRGNHGLIIGTDRRGKMTDRLQLEIRRDRYGNLLARRVRWEIEDGIPSRGVDEVRYRISYVGGKTSTEEAGETRTRGIAVARMKNGPRGAFTLTPTGPVPMRLNATLLSAGGIPHVLYAADGILGTFPLPRQRGEATASESGEHNDGLPYQWVNSLATASGGDLGNNLMVCGVHNNLSGTVWGTYRLTLQAVRVMPSGKLEITSNPTTLSDIQSGHANPTLLWFPTLHRYLLVAENMDGYGSGMMPGLSLAMVDAQGAVSTTTNLPAHGFSPQLARTRRGVALCYVQRRDPDISSLWQMTSPDGTQWSAARQILPDLRNVKTVAAVGDGRGTLYLLVFCQQMHALANGISPATVYRAVSYDDGRSWSAPEKLLKYQTDYNDTPAPALALDANGTPWYCLTDLGALRQTNDSRSRQRDSARLIVGRWE